MTKSLALTMFLLLAGCSSTPARLAERARAIEWTVQDSTTAVSLRGLAAVNHRICWAGGAEGTVLRTIDGGLTWGARRVPGAEALDFRSVAARDDRTAWIASAGSPAQIYRTDDAGATWTLQYENDDPAIFIDALVILVGDDLVAMSDPVDGAMLLLRTRDGGGSWHPMASSSLPAPMDEEHGYAASGTCLAADGTRRWWFGLGGPAARVISTTDGGATWHATDTPLARSDTAGVFSLAFVNGTDGVALGGDYLRAAERTGTAAFTHDGGRTWTAASVMPGGYRSGACAVRFGSSTMYLSTGTNGCDASVDGGDTWFTIPGEGYNAIDAGGASGWAIGANGRIAHWSLR